MLPPPDVALAHYSDRQSLVTASAEVAGQMWANVDPARIVESWTMQVPELTAVLSGAQLGAARQADPYLDEVAAWQERDAETASPIDPRAFAGVASDGRSLASLLMSPAFSALQAIASGVGTLQSLSLGRQHLDTIARTQVADAGRLADGVSLTAHKSLSGYVRVVVGKTCSRCVVLAGKHYAWNAGFQRHPHCDCIHLPSSVAKAGKLIQNPKHLYDSMSTRERQRAGWSLADQQAIADGADLAQVTNAHRGVYEAGGRRYTREGTTKRGFAGSRLGKRARMTPEQIYAEAADRDEALRLLYDHGYLVNEPAVVSRRSFELAAAPMPLTGPATGAAALDSVPVKAIFKINANSDSSTWSATGFTGLPKPDPGAVAAVTKYLRDPGFANRRLRTPGAPLHVQSIQEMLGGPVDTAKAAKAAALADRHIAALDRVMAQSRLPGDIVTYRGVSLDVLGGLPSKPVGHTWTDLGFASTSTDRKVAEHSFAGQGSALLHVVAPKGTPALQLAGLGESEVLLGRGLTYRIVADRGLAPGGARLLDVEIVPAKKAAAATADLSKMTIPQLREVAKERGVKIPSGSRKADIQALLGASKTQAASSDLSKLTVPKLRELAKERGVTIPSRALKADIVKLLEGPAKVPAKAAVKKVPAKKAAVKRVATKPEDLTVAELRALAKEHGVYLSPRQSKPGIIAQIRLWEGGRPPILPGTAERRAAAVAARAAKDKALADDWKRWDTGRHVDIRPGNLPPIDPANPLAAYGNRLTVEDRGETAHTHLADLETIPVQVHRRLQGFFARRPKSGFYVGDVAVPELDELSNLRGVQPRGWGPGQTWDIVPGAYSGATHRCALGGGTGTQHGSTSLALHEAGHALDHAMEDWAGRASGGTPWQYVVQDVLSAVPESKIHSYFTPGANPTGYHQEMWAESFAAWVVHRGKPDVASRVGIKIASRATFAEGQVVGRLLVDYFEQLDRRGWPA